MVKVLLENVAQERRENIKTSKDNFPVVGLEHIIPMQIQLTDWSTDKDNTFTKVFKKGDILFGRRRAYLKKAALAPFDGICSGDITVISPIAEKIEPTLLPFIIQNDDFFDVAVEKSAGSLSPRVKWEHLKTYSFELPFMEKQRELAQILWAAEETKQSYKSLLQKTDDLVKAKFEEMFENCDKCKLSDLAEISVGQSSPYDDEFSKVGIPFIKAGNLESLKLNKYTEYDCNLVSEDIITKKKLKLHKKGTVLVAKSGMSCLSGHVYTLKVPSFVVSHLACIEYKKNISFPEFIKIFFDVVGVKELIKDPSYPSIQLQQFAEMKIPKASYNQQKEFAEFAKQAEKSKQKLQKSLEQLNATTKALINENLK